MPKFTRENSYYNIVINLSTNAHYFPKISYTYNEYIKWSPQTNMSNFWWEWFRFAEVISWIYRQSRSVFRYQRVQMYRCCVQIRLHINMIFSNWYIWYISKINCIFIQLVITRAFGSYQYNLIHLYTVSMDIWIYFELKSFD